MPSSVPTQSLATLREEKDIFRICDAAGSVAFSSETPWSPSRHDHDDEFRDFSSELHFYFKTSRFTMLSQVKSRHSKLTTSFSLLEYVCCEHT